MEMRVRHRKYNAHITLYLNIFFFSEPAELIHKEVAFFFLGNGSPTRMGSSFVGRESILLGSIINLIIIKSDKLKISIKEI